VARALARVGDLAVIADPHHARQGEAKEAFGGWGTQVVSEQEVAFRECDAVWISTPTALHNDSVRAALMAGRHVMCEKPVVTDSRQAAALVELARENELVLAGGFLTRFMEAHYALLDFPLAQARGIVVERRNTQASLSDGDVLWGLGPHDIASLLAAFGALPDKVVRAEGTTHRVQATLTWQGIPVELTWDWLAEKRFRRLRLLTGADTWVELADLPERHEPLLAEAQHWVELIEGRRDRAEDAWLVEAVTSTLYRIHRALNGEPEA